jgi:hypothetical protein
MLQSVRWTNITHETMERVSTRPLRPRETRYIDTRGNPPSVTATATTVVMEIATVIGVKAGGGEGGVIVNELATTDAWVGGDRVGPPSTKRALMAMAPLGDAP